ncbi:hypothetical protein, conserved [Leishmania lindenbergi]|uniref:Uncharacterized protein n=1 Tax=Leishmania lindenbergi TaxID=651832 RepID=A0AAW3AYM0_9TRYP
MDSQEQQQHRSSVQKSENICHLLQLYSGHHQRKPSQHGAHHPSSPATSNKSPVMVPDVRVSVCNTTPPSVLPPNRKPLEHPDLPTFAITSILSPSQVLNASVSTSASSIASSTPVRARPTNSMHSRAPESLQPQQCPLPHFCEAVLPLSPRKTDDARPLRRSHAVSCENGHGVNAPLAQCLSSSKRSVQDARGAKTGLSDIGMHVRISATALMPILPVTATHTAAATDYPMSAATPSLPMPRIPHQKRGGRRALHRCNDSGSGNPPRVTGELGELYPSITLLPPVTATVRVTQAKAATGRSTTLQPRPPFTCVPFMPYHPSVVVRPQPAQSSNPSESRFGAPDAFGRSTLAESLSHTSHMFATGYGASEGSEQLRLLSLHPQASLKLLDPEEVSEDRGDSLKVLSPWPPSQLQSSLTCPFSTPDGAEGKSHTDSFVGVSDTLYSRQLDSERLPVLSSACRRVAYSVNASRDMPVVLPFIDPFAEFEGMPCGRRTSSSTTGLLASFGTPAGTMNSSDSVLENSVAALPGSGSVQTRSWALGPPPARSGGSSCATHTYPNSGRVTMATMCAVESSYALAAAQPGRFLCPASEEKQHQVCEQPPNHDFQKICDTAAPTTPRSTHHSAAHISTLEASMNDCSVVQSSLTATTALCARRKSLDGQKRKQLLGSCTSQHCGPREMRGTSNRVDSVAAISDTVTATTIFTTPSFTRTVLPQGTATPTTLSSRVSLSASKLLVGGIVLGASPQVAVAAAATQAAEEGIETGMGHGSSLRLLERQWASPSCSASTLSMRSSPLGRSNRGPAAAGGRSGPGGQRHDDFQCPSFMSVPPLVYGAQALPFCSLTASGVRAWVEECSVDAPIDICATSLSSLFCKTDSQLRTADSSVSGRRNLWGPMPHGECAVGVSGVLRPSYSFHRSRLALPSEAKRSGGCSSRRKSPLPPSLPATVDNLTNNSPFQGAVFVDSCTPSVVKGNESDAGSVAATTTTMTTTAVTTIARLTSRVIVSQMGPSSTYREDEGTEMVSDMRMSFAPARNAAIMRSTVREEMRPSRIRLMDTMLEHPDAPPFAKAAAQRLHERRTHQLQQAQSHGTYCPPDLVRSDVVSAAAEVPVIVTTTTSIRSCSGMSNSCMTQPQTSSGAAAGADDPHHQEQVLPLPSNKQGRAGQLSASLVPCLYHAYHYPCDVHKHSKQQQHTTMVSFESVKAINPLQPNALVPRAIVDASTPVPGCLTAAEEHLPKVLPVKPSGPHYSIKCLFGL